MRAVKLNGKYYIQILGLGQAQPFPMAVTRTYLFPMAVTRTLYLAAP